MCVCVGACVCVSRYRRVFPALFRPMLFQYVFSRSTGPVNMWPSVVTHVTWVVIWGVFNYTTRNYVGFSSPHISV